MNCYTLPDLHKLIAIVQYYEKITSLASQRKLCSYSHYIFVLLSLQLVSKCFVYFFGYRNASFNKKSCPKYIKV